MQRGPAGPVTVVEEQLRVEPSGCGVRGDAAFDEPSERAAFGVVEVSEAGGVAGRERDDLMDAVGLRDDRPRVQPAACGPACRAAPFTVRFLPGTVFGTGAEVARAVLTVPGRPLRGRRGDDDVLAGERVDPQLGRSLSTGARRCCHGLHRRRAARAANNTR